MCTCCSIMLAMANNFNKRCIKAGMYKMKTIPEKLRPRVRFFTGYLAQIDSVSTTPC